MYDCVYVHRSRYVGCVVDVVACLCVYLCIWRMYAKMTSLCVVDLQVSCASVFVCVYASHCVVVGSITMYSSVLALCVCGVQMATDMRRCVCLRMC